jgi:addiction module HigA family antidote
MEEIMTRRTPLHAGHILYYDYIEPLKEHKLMTIKKMAGMLDTSEKNLSELIHGKVGISPQMAIKLSLVLGTSAEFWMNLQKNYELCNAQETFDKTELQKFGKYHKEFQNCLNNLQI